MLELSNRSQSKGKQEVRQERAKKPMPVLAIPEGEICRIKLGGSQWSFGVESDWSQVKNWIASVPRPVIPESILMAKAVFEAWKNTAVMQAEIRKLKERRDKCAQEAELILATCSLSLLPLVIPKLEERFRTVIKEAEAELKEAEAKEKEAKEKEAKKNK